MTTQTLTRLWHRLSLVRLIAPGLALLLVLSNAGLGLARGQAPAAGTMTLCIGAQILTVAIDAEGQPLQTRHVCPDCLGLALTETRGPTPSPPYVQSRGPVLRITPAVRARTRPAPPARAPPLSV